MSVFETFLGGAAVLLVCILSVVLANNFAFVPEVYSPPPHASSTISLVAPALPAPSLTLPDLGTEASSSVTVATSSPVKVAPSTPTPKPVKTTKTTQPVSSPAPTPAQDQTPATAPTSSGSVSLDASASVLRNSLVNIICYAPAGSPIHSISGSGVIIDSKGVILTNAHVAQYFLLADQGVDCTIRTGSPAKDSYDASLIYISPLWIRANAKVLTEAAPTGTGQYDFALLGITKSVTNTPLPAVFPAISLATLPPASGTAVVIASYGAQFLASSQIESSLFPTVVFGSIKDIYTFALNTIDVLSLGGSAAAQEGSSGGGVSDSSGKLVATITTSTVEGDTSTRTLDAITASYIRAEYATEMSEAIDVLLAESVANSVAEFAPETKVLEPILTAQLH
jgi:hypothetical protein